MKNTSLIKSVRRFDKLNAAYNHTARAIRSKGYQLLTAATAIKDLERNKGEHMLPALAAGYRQCQTLLSSNGLRLSAMESLSDAIGLTQFTEYAAKQRETLAEMQRCLDGALTLVELIKP